MIPNMLPNIFAELDSPCRLFRSAGAQSREGSVHERMGRAAAVAQHKPLGAADRQQEPPGTSGWDCPAHGEWVETLLILSTFKWHNLEPFSITLSFYGEYWGSYWHFLDQYWSWTAPDDVCTTLVICNVAFFYSIDGLKSGMFPLKAQRHDPPSVLHNI